MSVARSRCQVSCRVNEGSARPLIQYEKGEGGGGGAHHATRQQVCAHKARQVRNARAASVARLTIHTTIIEDTTNQTEGNDSKNKT